MPADDVLLTALRGLMAAAGLLLAALAARRATRHRHTEHGALLATLAGFALIAAVDQLTRVGEPTASWRLPSYAIVLTVGLVWAVTSSTTRR